MDTVLQEHIRRTTLVILCIDIPLIIAGVVLLLLFRLVLLCILHS